MIIYIIIRFYTFNYNYIYIYKYNYINDNNNNNNKSNNILCRLLSLTNEKIGINYRHKL